MAKLEAMWGTCDGYAIIFTQVSEDTWTCDVPVDLSDGTYIVEIYAKTYSGFYIYTTAVLYLCDSRCVSLELVDDGIYVVIKPIDYDIKVVKDTVDVCVTEYNVKLIDDGIKVVII